MVVFFLLLSSFLLQLMPSITLPDSAELVLFPFLLSGLFLSFLSLNPFKGGLSSLLFFLVACHLKSYIILCQFRGGDNHPLGWPGGGLRVSDWRALVVQMHSDGWGKTSLGMGVHLSSPLFWPSHWW